MSNLKSKKNHIALYCVLSISCLSRNDTICIDTIHCKEQDTTEIVEECKNAIKASVGYIYGKASFYAGKFIGRRTANGEIFTSKQLTCAHPTYKFGTKLIVTNVKNGKSVQVRVNDRGGFVKYGRTIDLSKEAFTRIAKESSGVIKVKIQKL